MLTILIGIVFMKNGDAKHICLQEEHYLTDRMNLKIWGSRGWGAYIKLLLGEVGLNCSCEKKLSFLFSKRW